MTVIDTSDQDNRLMKLWTLITELSDQLNQNRDISAAVYQQAGGIKTQAIHTQTGFVLRRFNLDKPKDVYDAELERMNSAMTIENIALQHDNKQLNALIREYEQTLETLMNTFRNRANDVQERELALSREYESQLLARQEECDSHDLGSSTIVYESLGRISHVLRQLLRAHGGEPLVPDPPAASNSDDEPSQVPTALQAEDREPWTTTLATREPWTTSDVTGADHALDREIELARLEKENEELRRMLGIMPPHNPAEGQAERAVNTSASVDHENFNTSLQAAQQPQPRLYDAPLTLGGFNVPRRPHGAAGVGMNHPSAGSLTLKRRALAPP